MIILSLKKYLKIFKILQLNTLKNKLYLNIKRVDLMQDEFLESYFKKLSEKIDNPEFINELKRELENSKIEEIEDLIKRYY